jgi:CBS domain-containing protein
MSKRAKAKTKKREAEEEAENPPETKKQRTENGTKAPPPQGMETTLAISDKNVLEMLKIDKPKYPTSDQFLLFMARMRPQDLPLKEKSIITFQRTDSLSHVMKTLSEHNILSAPVVTQVGAYYGFIDMLDVVRFVTDLVGENIMTKHDFDLEKIDEFKSATVQHLMKYPISKKNPFHPVSTSQSLLSVIEILATGVHRVPVINESNEIKHLVTQSSVIKFIKDHLEILGAVRKKKIHETDFGIQYVVSVLHNEAAIDAFKLLKICNVSGLAIVDDNGSLIGVISARDIKRISSTAAWISRLFKPVSEFVQNKPVVVRPDDTLEHALVKCVEYDIHRVFVVNEQLEPVGVISLTDILHEFMKKNGS